MAASVTDNPVWVKKMKARFTAMDVDKNGVINYDDVALLAKNLAAYRKEGKDAEKCYFDTLKSVWSYGIGEGTHGANEDEFIQGMRKFVIQPNARELVNAYSAMVFAIIDADKNGVIDFDEFTQFHKASTNMSDELIKHLFTEADTNGDGVIDVSEFEESTAKFLLSAD